MRRKAVSLPDLLKWGGPDGAVSNVNPDFDVVRVSITYTVILKNKLQSLLENIRKHIYLIYLFLLMTSYTIMWADASATAVDCII